MKKMFKGKMAALCAGLFVLSLSSLAYALPALQLGPGAGDWTYDNVTETWVTSDNPLNLLALANATKDDGGNGKYAWDSAGAETQTAYLVVSAVPKAGNATDIFDITVSNATSAGSGFGAPPLSDSNALASHGIFDTYFELYEFQFDGVAGLISNTQPGDSGTGQGFTETFDITINSLADGVSGLHFDLFTMKGDGSLANNEDVKKFAPFSHDAEFQVPEPASSLLLALGLLALGVGARRKIAS